MSTRTHDKMDILLDSMFVKYTALFEASIDQIYEKYYSGVARDEFDAINKADPTSKDGKKKGKYLQWLLKLRAENKLKMEDLYKATKYLKIYTKYKNQIEEKDINKIKSLPDLYGQVKDIMKSLETEEGTESLKSSKEKTKEIKKQAEKYYEDEKWLIIIPKTKEASCLYGKGTQWCTAADVSENMFDEYNDQGPLYIMIHKPTNEKYQYHAETESFMDAEDADIAELIDEAAGDANADEMSEYEYERWLDDFYDIPEVEMVNSIPDAFIDKLVNDKRSIKYFIDLEERWDDGIEKFGRAWRNADPSKLIETNPAMHFAYKGYREIDNIYNKMDLPPRKKVLSKVIPILLQEYNGPADLNFSSDFYRDNPYVFDIYLDAILDASETPNDIARYISKMIGYSWAYDQRGKIQSLEDSDRLLISKRIMSTLASLDLSVQAASYMKDILAAMSDDLLNANKKLAEHSVDAYERVNADKPSPEQYAKWIAGGMYVKWDAGIPSNIPEEYRDEQVIWDAIAQKYAYSIPYDDLSDLHKGLALKALIKSKAGQYTIKKLFDDNKTFPESFKTAHVKYHADNPDYYIPVILEVMSDKIQEYKSDIVKFYKDGKSSMSVWMYPLDRFKLMTEYMDEAGVLDKFILRATNSNFQSEYIRRENLNYLYELKKDRLPEESV